MKDKKTIDPNFFKLNLTMTAPLFTLEPSEYLTQAEGEIILWEEERDTLAGHITLTLYQFGRAEVQGQHPREVFDYLSEESLELYQEIYDGFHLREEVRAIVDDVLSPSLLVIETVEVLPQFRGGGLGLAAALKAMHMLGPAAGIVALIAAPLNPDVSNEGMKMEEFAPDSPLVREKLGRYWKRLGFRRFGCDGLLLRNMENLPLVGEVLAQWNKKRKDQ